MMSIDDIERAEPDDEELFAGLHRSVAGAALTTSTADVVALGHRVRRRRRTMLAGLGTSAAALVAAVGVLAPATGGGRSQNVGFTMEHRADGGIELTLSQSLDPVALQNAMDDAGITTDIQVVKVPDSWDVGKGVECVRTPGVTRVSPTDAVTTGVLPNGKHDYSKTVIYKSRIPAGAVIALAAFHGRGGQPFFNFGLLTGKPDKCVPTQDFAHNRF